MDSLKLYRLLQEHVGKLNHLVVALFKEQISADKALEQARSEIEKLRNILSEQK